VVIPPAVERELKDARELHEGLDWSVLRVVKPESASLVNSLRDALDLRESEAIVSRGLLKFYDRKAACLTRRVSGASSQQQTYMNVVTGRPTMRRVSLYGSFVSWSTTANGACFE